MTAVTISELVKEFDDVVAVNELNIDIRDGDFLVIVGPSGCGKSTTLNCLAGLERPTDGSIRLKDEDITFDPPQERNIAMVFQNYALYPHMSVRKNMGFGLKMSTDKTSEEINERVEEIAALLDITELLDQQPKELSGGQQQRVALGRAIVREPDLFLMDEPLSNLDAKLRSLMRTEIQQLQNQLGITTVYVTHDQVEAMTMGDQIAVMNDGELQQIGDPLEIYYQPANQFVAGFIGSPSMNFFTVKNHDSPTGVELVHDRFTFTMSDWDAPESVPQECVLGIRPQDFALAQGDEANVISVTVDVTESLGDQNLVYFSFGRESYTASLPPQHLPSPGETIELTAREQWVHVFDSRTGDSVKAASIQDDSIPVDPSNIR